MSRQGQANRARRVGAGGAGRAGPAPSLPDIGAVRAAARRLKGRVRTTPLLESAALNALVGGRVLVKAEALQHTGSFKARGAYNKLLRLGRKERARGVVAFSSGNHALGVAGAAAALGAPAVIVMPSDAPRIKIRGTRAFGAELVLYDRLREDREEIAERLAAERGLTLIRSFDDPDIIAGQGTVGLEIVRQAKDHAPEPAAPLDMLLVPCSGGGLVSGCALALAAESAGTAVYAVEPEGFDDTARSLAAGERRRNAPGATTFCDALLVETPGILTFAIMAERLAGGLTVSDAEVARAMAAAFDHLKLVLEPGGAAALAAVLAGRVDCRGKTVAVVGSGGNVDRETFCGAISGAGEDA